jgi:hypothetical protein
MLEDFQIKRAISIIKNQNLNSYYSSQKIFKELNTTDGFLKRKKNKYFTVDSIRENIESNLNESEE